MKPLVFLVSAVAIAIPSAGPVAQSGCASGPLGALAFNGTTMRVTVPYSPTFPIEVFSLTAWVRPAVLTSATMTIIGRQESPVTDHLPWHMYLRNGLLHGQIENSSGAGATYAGTTVLPTGAWSHVAVTRTSAGAGAVLTLYVNGVQDAVYSPTLHPSANNAEPLNIGMTRAGSGGATFPAAQPTCCWFNGEIDEVGMWDVTLSAAQVLDIHRCPPAAQAGLVGLWKFDEGAGQTVIDSSGAGNHGFLGDTTSVEAIDPLRIASTAPFCRPALAATQAGPGAGSYLDITRLTIGKEYFNIFSIEPCPGGPGTGIWFGLCVSDPLTLVSQFLLPVETPPFHFVAPNENRHYGPFFLPAGMTVEGVCFDFTAGVLGRVSAVMSLTVQ